MRTLLRRLGADGLLAIVFLAVAGLAYWETLSFPVRAATWPQWTLIAFGGLSAAAVVAKLIAPEGEK